MTMLPKFAYFLCLWLFHQRPHLVQKFRFFKRQKLNSNFKNITNVDKRTDNQALVMRFFRLDSFNTKLNQVTNHKKEVFITYYAKNNITKSGYGRFLQNIVYLQFTHQNTLNGFNTNGNKVYNKYLSSSNVENRKVISNGLNIFDH